MDLTFQVPVQYCSLEHWTLPPSPVTSTTGCFFHFGSVSSFSLELFLYSSPIVYWAPPDLGSSSFSVVTFLPFHTVHGVLKARIHSGCHSLPQRLVRVTSCSPGLRGGCLFFPRIPLLFSITHPFTCSIHTFW